MTKVILALAQARSAQEMNVPGKAAIELPIDKLMVTGGRNGEPLRAYVTMKDLEDSLALAQAV